MYDLAVQQIKKHFVHDFGARSQHGAYQEDYEEGGGETNTNMNLQNFGDDENWQVLWWMGNRMILVMSQVKLQKLWMQEGGIQVARAISAGFVKMMMKN